MKLIKSTFYVVSLLYFSACSSDTESGELVNSRASLPASFGFSEMHLKVISSLINKNEGTTSILYGNEKTVVRLREKTDSITAGEQLTLLTWKQQEDAHWLGAKIPDQLLSAETVRTDLDNKGQLRVKYEKYQGKELAKVADTLGNANRKTFLLAQRASVMP